VLRVGGKGTKIVLVPLPPAVSRAIDREVADRTHGPVLPNSRGARMDRHAAARRLRRLAETAGIQAARAHPHIAARHADPRMRSCVSTSPRRSPAPRWFCDEGAPAESGMRFDALAVVRPASLWRILFC
jgi:hypothetical protein